MAASEFLEDLVSHLPAIQLWQQVGYRYLTRTKALDHRDGRRSRPLPDSPSRDSRLPSRPGESSNRETSR